MLASYPWYIADWRESETRIVLTLPQRALYRELIDYCYLEGSVPVDPTQLSRIAACSIAEIRRYMPAVESLFVSKEGRLYHAKVTEVRARLELYHEQKRHAGAVSGKTRRERKCSTSVGTMAGTKDYAPLKSAIECSGADSIQTIAVSSMESCEGSNGRLSSVATQDEPSPSPAPTPSPTPDTALKRTTQVFDFEAWFNTRMTWHPNKKFAMGAKRRICELSEVHDPAWRDEFVRVHELWCYTEEWRWKGGAKCPTLEQWIIDQGWRWEPPGYVRPAPIAPRDEKGDTPTFCCYGECMELATVGGFCVAHGDPSARMERDL